MASRIKIAKGISEDFAVLILQEGVWHVVAEGPLEEMESIKANYLKDYPFLETYVNLGSADLLKDFSSLKPGLFHQVRRRGGAKSPFKSFN